MSRVGRAWRWTAGAGAGHARIGGGERLVTLAVLIVALLFPLAEGGSQSVMGLATLALVYGLVTMSLNLLMGYGGQVSVGQAGSSRWAPTPRRSWPPTSPRCRSSWCCCSPGW